MPRGLALGNCSGFMVEYLTFDRNRLPVFCVAHATTNKTKIRNARWRVSYRAVPTGGRDKKSLLASYLG